MSELFPAYITVRTEAGGRRQEAGGRRVAVLGPRETYQEARFRLNVQTVPTHLEMRCYYRSMSSTPPPPRVPVGGRVTLGSHHITQFKHRPPSFSRSGSQKRVPLPAWHTRRRSVPSEQFASPPGPPFPSQPSPAHQAMLTRRNDPILYPARPRHSRRLFGASFSIPLAKQVRRMHEPCFFSSCPAPGWPPLCPAVMNSRLGI